MEVGGLGALSQPLAAPLAQGVFAAPHGDRTATSLQDAGGLDLEAGGHDSGRSGCRSRVGFEPGAAPASSPIAPRTGGSAGAQKARERLAGMAAGGVEIARERLAGMASGGAELARERLADTQAPGMSSPSGSSRPGVAGASVASGAPRGRGIPGGVRANLAARDVVARRPQRPLIRTAPMRTSADARSLLQRSLRADGQCFAVCISDILNLEKLAVTTSQEANSASPAPAVPSQPSEPASRREQLGGIGSGASLARSYGSGADVVLQLRLFGDKDLFAFRFGCIVCWSFSPQEIEDTKRNLRDFMERALPAQDHEEDSMEFVLKKRSGDDDDDEDDGVAPDGSDEDGSNAVKQDQIILSTSSPLERLAHSYAMAQSVRLGVFEIAVDRSIANTRSIPETMATRGEVNLDPRELSKQMGELLMLRCDVNLHTDILDTPEIFWDEEQFEPHYDACRRYLDVDKRVDILNQRLGVLKDLYDMLQNSFNVQHGNKLEWIIIILILLEVLLEFFELLHDAWGNTK